MKNAFKYLNILFTCGAVLGRCFADVELLVIDDSMATHSVSVWAHSSECCVTTNIATDVSRFDVLRNGRFISKSIDGKWNCGKIASDCSVVKQVLCPNTASNVVCAALAPHGNRVAWIAADCVSCRLVITEHIEGQTAPLYEVTTNGVIAAPSWSPDGEKIAFFCGSREVIYEDGYSLLVLDLSLSKKEPKVIGPPSLWTRLSPARTVAPSWSPDGSSILFEARYDKNDMPGGYYIVSIDGQGLAPFPSGTWKTTGKGLYVLRQKQNIPEEFVIERCEVGPKRRMKVHDTLRLTGRPSTVAISPSGTKVAAVCNCLVYVYDLVTRRSLSVRTRVDPSARLNWICPKADCSGY